jgi:hypothetical protein
MDIELLEYRLALVERQIADAERHVTMRRDIVARLEADGLSASETAGITRDLLRQIEASLRARNAERQRLQAQLRRAA